MRTGSVFSGLVGYVDAHTQKDKDGVDETSLELLLLENVCALAAKSKTRLPRLRHRPAQNKLPRGRGSRSQSRNLSRFGC